MARQRQYVRLASKLERGRVLLEAADKLTTDAEALARGWETHLTLVTEALVPTPAFF
ncbi:hypothetical protein MJH54_28745, partial [Salmonella enterica subsp. enterica serovar Montevideo]|nr:hypothetical protein [Salmonella enterica subsp. enterica serovar Montevideo]